MIKSKRPNTVDEYGDIGFIQAKVGDEYKNIDHIYDSDGNIIFQQGYLNEYQGADDFGIPAIGKPLDDYTIWGNTKQDGFPTYDNPVEPEFCGERTENLFDPENCEVGLIAPDGSVRTTATYCRVTPFIEIDPSAQSKFVLYQQAIKNIPPEQSTKGYMTIARYDENKVLKYRGYQTLSSTDEGYIRCGVNIYSDVKYIRASVVLDTVDQSLAKIQPMILADGTADPVYIPYGYKIGISSGGVNLFDPDNCVVGIITDMGALNTSVVQSRSTEYIKVDGNTYISFGQKSFPTTSTSDWFGIAQFDSEKRFIKRSVFYIRSQNEATILLDSTTDYVRITIRLPEENTLIEEMTPMLNLGSTPLPYVPYVTPTVKNIYLSEPLRRYYDYHNGCSDYIDYRTNKYIKTVGFFELTGQETNLSIAHQSNFVFALNINDSLTPTNPSTWARVMLCSHGIVTVMAAGALPDMVDNSVRQRVGAKQLYFKITGLETLDDFRAWLAEQYANGTPVKIWYVLSTPIETDIELPDIPTLQKGLTTVIDVETEVEPSEVDVTYRGATKPKYDLFLAKNGDSFEAQDGQSLYIGGNP